MSETSPWNLRCGILVPHRFLERMAVPPGLAAEVVYDADQEPDPPFSYVL